MGAALVVAFLSFALAVSWVSGAHEQDRLTEERDKASQTVNTLKSQNAQAKAQAARDSKKLRELGSQIQRLASARSKSKAALAREKKRRKSLVRLQAALLKKKMDKKYETQIVELEEQLNEAEYKIEQLEEEKLKLQQQHDRLLRERGALLGPEELEKAAKEPIAPVGGMSFQKGSTPEETNIQGPALPEKDDISLETVPNEELGPDAALEVNELLTESPDESSTPPSPETATDADPVTEEAQTEDPF